MSPKRFITILRRTDPDLLLSKGRSGSWVVQKKLPRCVYQHPHPDTIPSSGVFVVREIRHVPVTMFSLSHGLTGRSLETARRSMFWRRGISPDAVADAMDREDQYRAASKRKDARNHHEDFMGDYGKQIKKHIMGEPIVQGAELCQ